jgi:hypothetical protein
VGSADGGGIKEEAEAWMAKTGLTWPWDREQQYQKDVDNVTKGIGRWTDKRSSEPGLAPDSAATWNEQSGNSGSSTGSNTASTSRLELYEQLENLDCEISWEDLTLGEQIGQGNILLLRSLWFCGSSAHALSVV